jgi:F-type H+-transporting ATPase subunit b
MLMAEPATTSGTVAPAQKSGGFPPFAAETFPSQLFWLTITFVFLLVMMWRVAVPRIASVITERRNKIGSEIAAAEASRKGAEAAQTEYQAPLIEARERAREVTEETRAKFAREVEQAKAQADSEGEALMKQAESRLSALQAEARRHISDVAKEAVVDIVKRLTGETVSTDEAAAAVQASVKG